MIQRKHRKTKNYNCEINRRKCRPTQIRIKQINDHTRILRKIRFRSSFNGEIADEIKNRDKLFKKSKLHIDKDIYNAARYKVRKIMFNKNRS